MKNYKPRIFEEAMLIIDELFSEEVKRSCIQEMMLLCDSHFTLGLWIRNNWL